MFYEIIYPNVSNVSTLLSLTQFGARTPHPNIYCKIVLSSFGELQPRHGLDDKLYLLEILYKGAYFENVI